MRGFITAVTPESIEISFRAEGPDMVGDAVDYIRPGGRPYRNDPRFSYEALKKHGYGAIEFPDQ